MSAFTLPSGHGHHFRDKAFKSSFLFSFGIHVVILVAAGSMTLFRISGTTYVPSYTVDLVTLPAAVPSPSKSGPKPKPVPEKKAPEPSKAPKSPETPLPRDIQEEIKPSGGDEAARLERRKRIEELEMEARRLYESFTNEDEARPEEAGEPVESAPARLSVGGVSTGGGTESTPSSIQAKAYYDRIWKQIRSSWVPQGVTSGATLITVVNIRIATDGKITEFWLEKSSGNDYYDQSANRAIRKASPLPPPPGELGDRPLEVGINFKYPE